MTVAILGAGAFGTALAVTLARKGLQVVLWTRSRDEATRMGRTRVNEARLPGVNLPENVSVTAESLSGRDFETVLLAVPMQQLAPFLADWGSRLDGAPLVGCAKGFDLRSGSGSATIIGDACPASPVAVLTGPSFAIDIARGLPTALTLACRDDRVGKDLQELLSTPTFRLYRTTDVAGAELGGALKNVIAIAAGVVIGAGLGDSARASLMTRGFAEMNRLATALGARAETLAGLSGLGDLVLTCTSEQSRNLRFGLALGAGAPFDPKVTVEGAATARAAVTLAALHRVDVPVTAMVAALVDGRVTVGEAASQLLNRPLKQE